MVAETLIRNPTNNQQRTTRNPTGGGMTETGSTTSGLCSLGYKTGRLHRRPTSGIGRPAGMELQAMAVEFPVVHGHPNRLPFEGVLTLVDIASDRAPNGARGHRVILTREAANAALPS